MTGEMVNGIKVLGYSSIKEYDITTEVTFPNGEKIQISKDINVIKKNKANCASINYSERHNVINVHNAKNCWIKGVQGKIDNISLFDCNDVVVDTQGMTNEKDNIYVRYTQEKHYTSNHIVVKDGDKINGKTQSAGIFNK